jgi:formylglycine-generating enzyme required for sulfatase activity
MLVERLGIRRHDFDRLFPHLLFAITIAALVPVLELGVSEPISIDGYEHLSISVQKTRESFLLRWRGEAHPVLHFLLLRAVALFGHSKLALRSASIIPGVASVYLLGLIAARLCKNKTVALLTATAYGFSGTMRKIFIDVRSYPLALFFVIAAFYCLVDFLAGGTRRNRSLMLFGIFTSLAIASEYYAILFLLACLGTLALLLAAKPLFRGHFRARASRHWLMPFAAFGLPFSVIVCFYQAHMKYARSWVTSFRYPSADFYWAPGIPLINFVLRNLRADLNYMLPVQMSSSASMLGVLAVFVPLLLYRGLLRKQSDEPLASGAAGLLLLLLLAELIILSLLRLYPFGGLARQQSILFPFFTLTAFLLLDRFIGCLSTAWGLSWLKAGILGMTAAAIVANYSGVLSGDVAASMRPEATPQAPQEAPAGGATGSGARPARTAAGKAGIRWVRIPGGTFMMGADDLGSNAQPRHEVRIESFEMAQTLVTNKQYQACVVAGICTKAQWEGSWFAEDYQPVVGVDWNQAKTFSEWAGGRLPTEAEWEYAARSGGREQKYPWGNEESICERAVFEGCGYEPTAPVCSKPAGNTQQGLCDMAGNAWEWVQDWYHGSYYGAPTNARVWDYPAGSDRVYRGGSWCNDVGYAPSASRYFGLGNRNYYMGFRPARELPSAQGSKSKGLWPAPTSRPGS